MSLSRIKTWIAGDLLTALDLNNEINNVLNNPISLISPTTGVITFSTSQTFPVAQLSSAPVASSFLTSGTVASGGTLFFSTAATPLLDTLSIGTSGQVLTVSTDGKPGWVASATVSGAVVFSSQFQYADDFYGFRTGSAAGGGLLETPQSQYWTNTAEVFTFLASAPGGAMRFPVNAAANSFGVNASSGTTTAIYPFRASLNPDFTLIVAPNSTSTAVGWRMGLNDFPVGAALTSDPLNGIYWRVKLSSTLVAVVRAAGTETAVNTTAVMTSSFKPIVLRLQVTGAGTNVNIYTNGNLHSTPVTTNIPTTQLSIAFGTSSAVAQTMTFDGWQVIQDRNTSPF